MTKIVKVTMMGQTIPVNIESWALTFGTEPTASAVREAVKEYVQNVITQLAVWSEVTDDYLK